VATKVMDMPCSRAFFSASRRRSAAVCSKASERAMRSTAAALGSVMHIAESDPTYTATRRARCRRASPAAYALARSDVVEPSMPTTIAEGPSVPSSKEWASVIYRHFFARAAYRAAS
jgi:hypothetical protein